MPIDIQRDVEPIVKSEVYLPHVLAQTWGPKAQRPEPAQSIRDSTLRPLFVGAVSGGLHAVSRSALSSKSLIFGLGLATGTALYEVGKYEWNKYMKY